MIPHPTQIKYLEAEGTLLVDYVDGLSIAYPTKYLRGFCPCARCQGHGGGPATWTPPASERGWVVENVSPVGTYAFCIVWGDGHDTGIYSFEMLRKMDVGNFDASTMTPESEIPLLS